MEELIKSMEEELVGVWKFKTLNEGPDNRQWCASVNVNGRLVDTEHYPSIELALRRAKEIVEQLK